MGGTAGDLWEGIEDAASDLGQSLTDQILAFDPLAATTDALINGWESTVDNLTTVWRDAWDNVLNPVLEPVFGMLGFEDQIVIQSNVSVSRVNPEGLTRSRLTTAILTALSTDRDLSDMIRYTATVGPYRDAREYYKYARDEYIYGLPTTNLVSQQPNYDGVDAVLEDIEGEAITASSITLGSASATDIARYWLTQNDVTYVYHTDSLVIAEDTWYVDFAVYNTGALDITLHLKDITDTLTLEYPTVIPEEDKGALPYYKVIYHLDSDPGINLFWLYLKDSNVYPELTNASATYTSLTTLPIATIRSGGVNVLDSGDTALIESTEALMDKIKLPLGDITEAVTTQINGSGDRIPLPDLDKISDVFHIYGTSIYAESNESIGALFAYFSYAKIHSTVSPADYYDAKTRADASDEEIDTYGISRKQTTIPTNVINITETTFRMAITYNYIQRLLVVGNIGEPGTYTSSVQYVPNIPIYAGGNAQSSLILRRQINSDTYEEITVHGLIVAHSVITPEGANAAIMEITATPNDNVIIPIPMYILSSMNTSAREVVLYEGMHIVAYASQIQYLEWYQSEDFTALVQIAAIFVYVVLLVISWGTSSTTTAAFIELMKQIAIKYAFEYVIERLLIEFTDADAATRGAIKAVASILYGGFDSDAFTFSFDMIDVDTLLTAVNSATQYVNTSTALEEDLLKDEMDSFFKDADELQEEIDNANDLLDTDDSLSFLYISATPQLINETPDQFRARTINNNPGVIVFNEIEEFVDNSLKLPGVVI